MTSLFVEDRILELRELLIKADLAYDKGEPIMSDLEYDKLYRELETLEKENPEFYDPNSPTQKIYAEKVEGLEDVKYGDDVFLGSEDKVYTEEEIIAFTTKSKSDIIAQFKEDGLTIYMLYLNGVLSLASTRGQNDEGQDVTHTVKTVKNIPKTIPFKGRLEVRAEFVIPFKEFERVNDELRRSGVPEEKLFKSPRNLAAGTVRLLDSNVAKERSLKGIVFGLLSAEGMTFKTDEEQMIFLQKQGFELVPCEKFENTPTGVAKLVKYCTEFNDKVRGTLNNAIDGLVMKFNDIAERERLGYSAKWPRWSKAYKFTSMKARTKILEIVHQVGKTGLITPVANLKPVMIETTISRATLHNYSLLAERDIRVGDTGIVEKAGDVIPHICGVIKEDRTGNEIVVTAPETCPECGARTEFDGEKLLYCTGLNCRPQFEAKVIYFASKPAMNIEGLGKETIKTFIEQGFIQSFSDIYLLDQREEEIVALEGYGKKRFSKMIAEIEASKAAPLNKVINALSIFRIGEANSKELAKQFQSMDEILNEAKNTDSFRAKILALKGFGVELTNTIVNFFSDNANVETIRTLQLLGVTMQSELIETKGDAFTGKTFVITGTLSKDRSHFKSLIESLGGRVSGSISGKTNFLLMGLDAHGTTKHNDAIQKKVGIITEEEFNQMIS